MAVDGAILTGLVWPLTIREDLEHGVRFLTLGGRLGAQQCAELLAILRGSGAQVPLVVVDLSGVDYISSLGLEAFQAAAAGARAAGGELVLCGLSDTVRLCFDLAGMSGHLRIEADRDAALAAPSRPATALS